MKTPAATNDLLRLLPSVDDILGTASAGCLIDKLGRDRTISRIRSVLDTIRKEIIEGSATLPSGRDELHILIGDRLQMIMAACQRNSLRRVINGTGIVLHTNLGRAPISAAAAKAMGEIASGYSSLEYDIETGKRGKRAGHLEKLLSEAVGAEAALMVNNGAAAAFLVISVFCKEKEVIVSRGELVEIGGGFRIPEVLGSAGAILKEVGTTNRTKLADYRLAIGVSTAMIAKIHPSNFQVTGFTKNVGVSELAELAHERGLIMYEDAGSGSLIDLFDDGTAGEPVISRSVAAGADLVSFSGDKLLGGVQAGIIVGRTEQIEALRRHPLYRVLRADKLAIAAMEATMNVYFGGHPETDIPALRMLKETPAALKTRAQAIAKAASVNPHISVEIVEGFSSSGGGSGAGLNIASRLLSIRSDKASANSIEKTLRAREVPLISRIENDNVLIDLRTVFPEEDGEVTEALLSL